MSPLDEYTLSGYLDGSLEYDYTCETADRIEKDSEAQALLLDMLKCHVLLKAAGQAELKQSVPAVLLDTVRGTPHKRGMLLVFKKPLFQLAASIVLVICGFVFGRNTGPGTTPNGEVFPNFQAGLVRTVDQALEYHKSGVAQEWKDQQNDTVASVTPVKTYRDDSGGFYRMYHIDMVQHGIRRHWSGVAYRKGKEKWQTQSVFMRDNPNPATRNAPRT